MIMNVIIHSRFIYLICLLDRVHITFEVFSFKTVAGIVTIFIIALMISLIISVMFTGKDNQDLDEQFLNEFVLPYYKKNLKYKTLL